MPTPAPRTSQVAVGDLRFHVAELGDPGAPPFLLLHGWPQDHTAWSPLMEIAAGEARMVAIDLPGVGRSGPGTCAGRKATIADAVRGLVARLGLDRPVVVGHDIGGMVAYAYLRRHDDAARAVAILDTAVPGVPPWREVVANPYIWHFAFHAVPGLPERLVDGRHAEYFDYFFDALAADPSAVGPAARAAYATAYRSPPALAAGFDFYRAFRVDVEDNGAPAEPTSTPLLYVRGGARGGDVEVYADGFRATGVRDVTTAVVDGAGHFVAEEAPAALWRLLRPLGPTVSAGAV